MKERDTWGHLSDRSYRLLLLEDIPSDAELVVQTLKKAPFKFSWKRVDSKNDFLKELINFMPDVIMSDSNLPQFSAKDALKLLQEKKEEIPFILVSGKLTEKSAADFIKMGAHDFVPKTLLERLPFVVMNSLRHQNRAKVTIDDNQKSLKEKMEAVGRVAGGDGP